MKNYFEFRCCNSASVEHFRYEVWNGAGFAGSAVCVAEVFHIVPDGDTGCGDVLVVVGLAEKNEFSRFLKRRIKKDFSENDLRFLNDFEKEEVLDELPF